ncbi:MAG: TlyA family RNA methyltransferase [Metamycoplasmataceae bacterium]
MKYKIKDILINKFELDKKRIDSLFLQKKILLNGEPVLNLEQKILDENLITIKEENNYVSRGAQKILKAFSVFALDVNNKVCLDIGSSTGGFTQVLLEKGAAFVYALDVGTNQLDFSLRINEKVKSMEKTNLKTINENMFDKKINFICADVSFISTKNIFNVITNLLDKDELFLMLLKPQFEAKREDVLPGGFVDDSNHEKIINEIKHYDEINFDFIGIEKSPIKGNKSKNIEYLMLFKKRK